MNLKLNSTVNQVKGVGNKYLQIFQKNGILTVLDLLLYFPIHYIDFSNVANQIEVGKKNLYFIEISGWNLSRRFGRRPSLLRVKARVGNVKRGGNEQYQECKYRQSYKPVNLRQFA